MNPAAPVTSIRIALRLSTGLRAEGSPSSAGRMGLRPTEWYSKPRRRIRSGSHRLRPSKITGRRIAARSRSRLRNLNSFHSGHERDRVGAGRRLVGDSQ